MEDIIRNITIMAIPILLAITLHEAAHGYVANYFGDPTAKMMGRLSLNPARHIDPFGTIIMPLLLMLFTNFIFGYAKPVPVTSRNLRNPKRDMIWVALAGPATNMILALIGGALFLTVPLVPDAVKGWYANNLNFLIFFNCLIAIFNMLPIPPLDGGRVIAGLLPGPLAYKYSRVEPYGIFIVVGIILILPMVFQTLGLPFDLGRLLVFGPAQSLYSMILNLFGIGY